MLIFHQLRFPGPSTYEGYEPVLRRGVLGPQIDTFEGFLGLLAQAIASNDLN